MLSPALLKFTPLLTKRLDEITFSDFQAVISAFKPGTTVTAEQFQAVQEFLKHENVDQVADLITNSGLVEKVMSQLVPVDNRQVVLCPHCGKPHILSLET